MLAADAAGVGSVDSTVGRQVDVSGLARDLGDREGGPRASRSCSTRRDRTKKDRPKVSASASASLP